MLKITLTGLPPFDGQFDLDFASPFTMRELHWIKEIAGVRVGELDEAGQKGDSDLLLAFTVIAAYRAGKVRKEQVKQFSEVLLDAPADAIQAEDVPDVEDDAGPPAQETPPASENGSSGNSEKSSPSSTSGGED